MSITWNPSDKSVNINLSNGNLTATATNTAWKSVRATESKSSGKWYWEVKIAAGTANFMVGVGTADASIDNYVGSDVYGYSYNDSTVPVGGRKFHSGSYDSYGDKYTLNDIIGVALDLDNGKIWWSKNGVWQASGDPAAGTNEAYSGLSGAFYPMFTPYTDTNAGTARFHSYDLTYDPPSGFTTMEYEAYFSGYVYEENISSPVSRKVYCYRSDDGSFIASTTSSGNGYYYLETTYSGSHFLIALDNTVGEVYNLVGLDYMIPVTIS